jgi:hypothetical protein
MVGPGKARLTQSNMPTPWTREIREPPRNACIVDQSTPGWGPRRAISIPSLAASSRNHAGHMPRRRAASPTVTHSGLSRFEASDCPATAVPRQRSTTGGMIPAEHEPTRVPEPRVGVNQQHDASPHQQTDQEHPSQHGTSVEASGDVPAVSSDGVDQAAAGSHPSSAANHAVRRRNAAAPHRTPIVLDLTPWPNRRDALILTRGKQQIEANLQAVAERNQPLPTSSPNGRRDGNESSASNWRPSNPNTSRRSGADPPATPRAAREAVFDHRHARARPLPATISSSQDGGKAASK